VSDPAHADRRRAPTKLGFGGVLRSTGFRRLLLGQSVSSLGDWVATLAFIAAAFALTSNQTAVAVVLILRLVPPIFAAPIGGVFADRFDRRVIMVTCDLSARRAIVLVPFVGIGLLYAIAFVHECISLFFLPARDASVPLLVRPGQPGEANGLVLATSYGTLPLAAVAFSGLTVAAGHIPHALPLVELLRRHTHDVRVLLRRGVLRLLRHDDRAAAPDAPGAARAHRAAGGVRRDSRTSFSTGGSARSPTGSWCRCSAAGCSSRSASRSSTRRCTGRTRSSAGWQRSGVWGWGVGLASCACWSGEENPRSSWWPWPRVAGF
jgi:hypothetical protein